MENDDNGKFWKSHLFGVIIGFLLSIAAVWANDYIRDFKAKNDFKQIISCDVEDTKSRFGLFFKAHSRKDMIKKSSDPEWAPNISDYDTSVFDAYIHKIPLLPEDSARRILLFYKNLKIINEAKYILQNNKGSDMSPENREVWTKVIYDGSYNTAKLGEDIIKDCSGQHTTKPDGSYWRGMSTASSTTD